MPHANLFGVTATLIELLRVNVWRLSGQEVTVSALPPEEAETETGSRLNLHLYHAREDPSRRNDLPFDDAGPYPISRTPMPLTLYYVMTAHSMVDGAIDPPGLQLLMGLGMKSLHDFPVIDDSLELPAPPVGLPTRILDPGMRGAQNRIEVVSRQLAPEDSVNFWSAAQNHSARLTAFYEVRSLLLPPEAATERPGIVTSFALGVTSSARPTLFASRSTQTVTLPALSGGTVLSTEVSPAVAALGTVAPPPGNRVVLTGEGLGDGSEERLVLSSTGFAALVPPLAEGVIDPASNPNWAFLFRHDAAEFSVQPEVNVEALAGFRAVPIRPGFYVASVRRNRQLRTEEGATYVSAVDSNGIPFAVAPAVAALAVVTGRIEVTLAPGVDCTDPLNQPQLSIAGDVYRLVPAFDLVDPANNPGTFIAAAADRYVADPLFDPADGGTRMVRVAVNGVDAAPVWLEP